MERTVIPFTTEEAWLERRTHDLTSSDIPDLFGVGYSDYQSLLHRKKNCLQNNIEETEEMRWGKALEAGIAQEFARQNGWFIKPKKEYIRIPELRLASSFDYEIERSRTTPLGPELLEIKNVRELQFKNNWIRGFELQATPYIEIQIQNELLVSGLQVGYIGALIGGCHGVLLRREANKKVQEAILKKVAEFWRKVDESK